MNYAWVAGLVGCWGIIEEVASWLRVIFNDCQRFMNGEHSEGLGKGRGRQSLPDHVTWLNDELHSEKCVWRPLVGSRVDPSFWGELVIMEKPSQSCCRDRKNLGLGVRRLLLSSPCLWTLVFMPVVWEWGRLASVILQVLSSSKDLWKIMTWILCGWIHQF